MKKFHQLLKKLNQLLQKKKGEVEDKFIPEPDKSIEYITPEGDPILENIAKHLPMVQKRLDFFKKSW